MEYKFKGYGESEKIIKGKLYRKKASGKTLSTFARTMKNNMKAGIPLLMALKLIKKQFSKESLGEGLEKIVVKIEEGSSLKDAFEKSGDCFPQFFKTMIFIGEESGNLQEIFGFLEGYYMKEYKRRKKIINVSIYPIFVLIFGMVMGTIIITKVLPKIISTIVVGNKKIPGITRFYLAISSCFNKYGIIIIILIALIILFMCSFYKKKGPSICLEKFKYKLPLIKNIVKKKFSCRFTLSLSMLLKSGVDFKSAIEILGSCENEYLKNKLKATLEYLTKGENLYSSMKAADIFPEYLLSSIYIGEINGSLDDVLIISNEIYEEELQMDLDRIIGYMEPTLMILVGLFVFSIVLAIMLPMISTYDISF